MNIAENFWRGSIAARTGMLAAANYATAFYGNAALQGVHLGLSAPLTFWQTMARAVDRAGNIDAAPDGSEAENVVALKAEAAAEAPVAAEPAAAADPQEAPAAAAVVVAMVEETAETETAETEAAPAAKAPNPHLLDAPRGGKADDLQLVRGVGAKLAANLNEIGIYHFDQLAGLDAEGIAWLDENIKGFKLACGRFDIVAGARALA